MAAAGLLAGCLVSKDPLLDAQSGADRPLQQGTYRSCDLDPTASVSDGEDPCTEVSVSVDATGLYLFADPAGGAPNEMRFRRIARKAYAMQSRDGPQSFSYFYAKGDARRLTITMMQCEELPEKLRERMIRTGELTEQGGAFASCSLNRLSGLVAAADAYRRGSAVSVSQIGIELVPLSVAAR